VNVVAPVSVIEDNLKSFDVTVPIMICRGAAYARKGSPAVCSAADLRAGRVVVAKAGIGEQWCIERGVPCKAAMNLRGLPGGFPRPPLQPMGQADIKLMREGLDKLGVPHAELPLRTAAE